MNSVQIAPRVWLNDGIFYGSNESSTDEPLYDQSAIDQLIAERDVLRIEKDRLQEIRQQLEAARDVALADAESLRRRMLVLERQRDEFVSREWHAEKAKRKAEADLEDFTDDAESYWFAYLASQRELSGTLANCRVLVAAASEVCAWVKSGNGVQIDIDYVFREQAQKIAADIRRLDATREQCKV